MKRIIAILIITCVFGCSYGQDGIPSLIRDPHYTQYQEKLDQLEKTYLAGTINYSDYLDQKQQLDDDYSKEVQDREEIIHSK